MAAIVLTCAFESIAAVQSDSSDHGPTPATQSPEEAVSSEKAPTEAAGATSLLLPAIGIGAAALIVWRRWYRLESNAPAIPATPATPAQAIPAIPPIPPTWPAYAAMLIGGYLLLGVLGDSLGAYLVGQGEFSPASGLATTMAGAYGFQLLAITMALVLASRLAGAGLPRPHGIGAATLRGVGSFVLLFPIVVLINLIGGYLAEAITQQPIDPIAHGTLELLVDHSADPWIAVVIAIVIFVAPWYEEVIYRGLLQRTMTGLGVKPWTAIAASSAIFVLMHAGSLQWHAMGGLFVLSLGFGWVYHKTGRLIAPVLLHVLFNETNVLLGLTLSGGG